MIDSEREAVLVESFKENMARARRFLERNNPNNLNELVRLHIPYIKIERIKKVKPRRWHVHLGWED